MSTAIRPAGGSTGTVRNLTRRLAIIERVASQGARVLDCGAGKGQYVDALRARGYTACGIEYHPDQVAAFQAAHPGTDWIRAGDIAALPWNDGTFDAALFNEVLEHVPDEVAALNEARRVLTPGGHVVIFSPNRWYPFESHGTYLHGSGTRLPVWTPFVPWVPAFIARRVFRPWARNYWPHELQGIVRAAGFNIVETGYVWQTFENISGAQSPLFRLASPVLRRVSFVLEQMPVLNRFGVSQLIIARKPDAGGT